MAWPWYVHRLGILWAWPGSEPGAFDPQTIPAPDPIATDQTLRDSVNPVAMGEKEPCAGARESTTAGPDRSRKCVGLKRD